MNSRRKVLILMAAFLALGFAVQEGIRKYPDVKADILEEMRRNEIYTLSGADELDKDSHARIDALVAFVHNNSEHNIDDEFWSDFKNKPRTLDKFLAFAKGESTDRPHMECSTRSKLLLPLLRKAGYEAHMVDMFKFKPEYNSHVVVEVKNDVTGNWELYDPTYQIYWKDERTGERASARDLVFSNKFTFIPCHDANRCGYNRPDHGYPPPADIKEFFGLAVLMNDDGDGDVMLVNPARFPLESVPDGGDQTFCDWGGERWCPKVRETPDSGHPLN